MGDTFDAKEAEQQGLHDLLASVQAVLFDFDGPVCDLFGGRSTVGIANEIKDKARGVWGRLDKDVEDCTDSHGVLQCLRDMYDRSDPRSRSREPLDLAEGIVAREELHAAGRASSAPGVVELLRLLKGAGKRLVVVTNNAPGPVRTFLERDGFRQGFEAVFGRDPYDARLMKPDPDCVQRALGHLRLGGEKCLMVGDHLTDLKAARSVSTCFLGYTQDEKLAAEMKQNGAHEVVASHAPVIEAAKLLPSV